MGKIVIAAFRPKPGKEDELLHVMVKRLPLMRRLGLATDRTNITMRAADGTILDISEWVDTAAIDRAHELPEVHELWRQYGTCCDYVKLDQLAECHLDFATFDAVSL
jgi:quinol monooxygenase YgiN